MSEEINTTTRTVLLLLARRAASGAAAILVAHGAVNSGDPNLSGFTEVVAGCLVWAAEFGVEWWRKSGMVLVSKQVARMKGIPLPGQVPIVVRTDPPATDAGVPEVVRVQARVA